MTSSIETPAVISSTIAKPTPSWQRDFRLLWSGSATSQLGTISAATAAPLIALTLTNSPVFTGWVIAASTAPGTLLHVPAGLLVDRYNRRFLMLSSQVIRLVLALALVAGLVIFDDHTLLRALLLSAAATDGALAVLYNTAEMTALQHIVKPEARSDAMGKNEARQHIALLLGRPLGGVFFGFHRTIPYLFDALTCVISIITLHRMTIKDFQPKTTNHTRRDSRPIGRIRDGVAHIIAEPVLRTVLLVCTVANFCFQTIVLLLVVSAREGGMPGSLIGLLLASSGLGGLLGAMAAPWVVGRISPKLVVIACVWGWLPLTLVIAASERPAIGLVAWGSLSFMGAHLNVALAIRQMSAPPELLGRVVCINGFFTNGSVALGACLAGYAVAGLTTRGAAELVVWIMSAMAIFTLPSISGGSMRAVIRYTSGLRWVRCRDRYTRSPAGSRPGCST